MLYAINKKRSRIAQESFLKFQYVLISSAIYVLSFIELNNEFFWLQLFYFIFSPVLHLIGGFAVLQVFRKNHPLARLRGSQVSEDMNQNFLEQNEVIATEFSKYDKQLNRWPYFIDKCLLKFSAVFELIFLCHHALAYLLSALSLSESRREYLKFDFYIDLFLVLVTIFPFLNACSCFQMEVATRTRNLAKVKIVFTLFKICSFLSIINCFFVGKVRYLDSLTNEGFLWSFVFSVIVPFPGLIGAAKVKKIIEQRDRFVKVSSYSEDLNL